MMDLIIFNRENGKINNQLVSDIAKKIRNLFSEVHVLQFEDETKEKREAEIKRLCQERGYFIFTEAQYREKVSPLYEALELPEQRFIIVGENESHSIDDICSSIEKKLVAEEVQNMRQNKYLGMKISDLAAQLKLHDKTKTVDVHMDVLLEFFATEIRAAFPELYPAIFRAEKYQLLSESEKVFIENKASKARNGIEYTPEEYTFGCMFGHTLNTKITGQDILDLGFLPMSCTSYAILTHNLLCEVGINSEVWYMEKTGREHLGGHSVLRYQREDGSWRRCDPKWERRKINGEYIFFKENPELFEAFASEQQPLLHGGHIESHDAWGKAIQVEHDKQTRIRPF